jgi:site-specific DNA-cytosine methylase
MCFFENVEGHISLGLREVIGELESMGYKVSWGIFSAREVGAPHQRKRVFIMAVTETQYAQGSINGMLWREDREDGIPREYRGGSLPRRTIWPSRPGQPQYAFEPPRVVANSASQRTNRGHQLCDEECGQGRSLPLESNNSSEVVGNADSLDRRTSTGGWIDDAEVGSAGEIVCNTRNKGYTREKGEGRAREEGESNGYASQSTNDERRQVEPTLGGDSDGTTRGMGYAELSVTCDNRTDELRLLGNGVVPATATIAFQTLLLKF